MTHRRGFSVIEMALAIVLIALLMGMVGVFASGMVQSRERLRERLTDLVAGGSAIDMLERDLLTCLAGGPRLGAGIEGGPERLTIKRRAVSVAIGAQPGAVADDLQTMVYALENNGDGAGIGVTETSASGARSKTVLGQRVERLRFRYFDGTEWTQNYSSLTSGTIPVAIEISIWMESAGEAEEIDDPLDLLPDDGLDISPEEAAFLESIGAGPEAGPDDLDADESDEPLRAPDRTRVIVIPDGPGVGWRDA